MIVLPRKRIIFIITTVCISLFAFSFRIAKTDLNTVQTVALPVSNKVIIIDAGHGGEDKRSRKQ